MVARSEGERRAEQSTEEFLGSETILHVIAKVSWIKVIINISQNQRMSNIQSEPECKR